MSKQAPPAPTASAIGPCPTVIKTVGRPGTGSLPSTFAPPDHPPPRRQYTFSERGIARYGQNQGMLFQREVSINSKMRKDARKCITLYVVVFFFRFKNEVLFSNCFQMLLKGEKNGNDEELIQSKSRSQPQNKKRKKHTHKSINVHERLAQYRVNRMSSSFPNRWPFSYSYCTE